MDDLLPSDLCKICHTNPNIYRCPRCSTRTCSLPCTKRHKQWAQCSGTRDPTAYVPRADLATSRGIDHDYNFLTSIERKLDGAERDTTERGVMLADDEGRGGGWKSGRRDGPVKGEVRLKEAMGICGVILRKAPTGMARAKQNKTFWNSKKKCVVWTVEWIHNGGRSELGSCPASVPISDAYAAQCVPIAQSKKRERDPDPPSTSTTTSNLPLPPPPPLRPTSASTSPSSPSPSSPTAKPSLHFYLLRPCTPPSTRVLIPLPCLTATLATSLRDRLVLEFPTIYALKYPPEKLPTGFVAEAEYLARRRASSQREEGVIWSGSDREEDRNMWRSGHADRDAEGGEARTAKGTSEEVMDANRFLAVLARDLEA